jgi:septal ring factor EnvC (AmiA/AmiB activator)
MAMFRRSPGSVTPFRQRREELARREAELRDGLDKLERMIAEAPRVARRRQQEELRLRATARDSRLDASVAQDKRYRTDGKSTSRRRPLRKERREGRLLFLVLVIAIAVVVIWLMSHLHF